MALSASSNSPGLPCHLVFPHPPLAKDLIGSICTRTWNGQKKLVKKYTAKRIQSPTANASEICSGSLGRLSSLTGRDLVPCRDTWMWSSVSIMFGKLKQSFGQCVMSLFGDGFGSKCTYTSRRRSLSIQWKVQSLSYPIHARKPMGQCLYTWACVNLVTQ